MIEQKTQVPEPKSQGDIASSRPPLPPFSRESAIQKVRLAEDGWKVASRRFRVDDGQTGSYQLARRVSRLVPTKRACIYWFSQLVEVGNSEGISKNDVANDGN